MPEGLKAVSRDLLDPVLPSAEHETSYICRQAREALYWW